MIPECVLLYIMPVMLSTLVAFCCCAGVAEFRGCSATNGGGGLSAVCSWKQHAARVGQPGHWSSASSGDIPFPFIFTPY